MHISVSGQNMNVGESLREYVKEELEAKVTKYFEQAIDANVVFSREAHLFRADIHVNDGTGMNSFVKGRGKSNEVYSSFDQACERIEKQLRRYKRRIKDHNTGAKLSEKAELIQATKYVLAHDGQEMMESADNPLIIAEKQTVIETLTVSDAVMRMDLSGLPALMFINKKTGNVDIVYNREDGNISWVESNIKTSDVAQVPQKRASAA